MTRIARWLADSPTHMAFFYFTLGALFGEALTLLVTGR